MLFPFIIVPLSVGRESSIRAVDQSLAENRMVLLVAQRDSTIEEPEQGDLYSGRHRRLDHADAEAAGRPDPPPRPGGRARPRSSTSRAPTTFRRRASSRSPRRRPQPARSRTQALVRSAKESMDRIVGLGKGVSPEVLVLVANLEDPGRLADLVASNLELAIPDAQRVLETIDGTERLKRSPSSCCARSSC